MGSVPQDYFSSDTLMPAMQMLELMQKDLRLIWALLLAVLEGSLCV